MGRYHGGEKSAPEVEELLALISFRKTCKSVQIKQSNWPGGSHFFPRRTVFFWGFAQGSLVQSAAPEIKMYWLGKKKSRQTSRHHSPTAAMIIEIASFPADT